MDRSVFASMIFLVAIVSHSHQSVSSTDKSQMSLLKLGGSYGTVLDVAENSFGCTTFVRLVKKAGLDKSIFNGKGPFTLFAPANDAFHPDILSKLEANSSLLEQVLRFHSTNEVIVTVKDIHHNDFLYPSCLANVTIRTNFYMEGTKVGVYMASGAFLNDGDYKADNGLVHHVLNLMYPIPDTNIGKAVADNKTFSILHDLIKFSGLEKTLEGGNYTLFAPTNHAFQALSPSILNKLHTDKSFCHQTLLRHMMNGTYYSQGLFNDQPELDCVGTYLHFEHSFDMDLFGSWKVENVPVVDDNLSKTNGVIHVLDLSIIPDNRHRLNIH